MAGMDNPPALPPEEQDHIREKTRRLLAVAALRRVHRLVKDYRAPIDLGRGISSGSLPDSASIPPHARRIAGYAALHKVQQLLQEYREDQAAARKAARSIAIFFAVLLAIGAVLYLTKPAVLEMLARMLS
jgi:hypothetical protein